MRKIEPTRKLNQMRMRSIIQVPQIETNFTNFNQNPKATFKGDLSLAIQPKKAEKIDEETLLVCQLGTQLVSNKNGRRKASATFEDSGPNKKRKERKPIKPVHLPLTAIFQQPQKKRTSQTTGQKKRKYPDVDETSKKRMKSNDIVSPIILPPPKEKKKRKKKSSTPKTPGEKTPRKNHKNMKSPGKRSNCKKRKPHVMARYKGFEWRQKAILMPDIDEIDICDWPDSGSEDEYAAEENLSNEAYLFRHHRAEMRERAFWHALNQWRREKERKKLEEQEEEENKGGELKVLKRPRGPWQFQLTREERESKPTQFDEETRFNYSHRLRPWKQPKKLIKRVSLDHSRRGSIKEMVNGRKGKDLGMAYARLHSAPKKEKFEPDADRLRRIKVELERRSKHFTFSYN